MKLTKLTCLAWKLPTSLFRGLSVRDFSSTDINWMRNLSRDSMVDVMSRLDGLSLMATACTCIELQDVARERGLWKILCQAIWPSTACTESMDIIPFDQFYAQSYPLLLYDGLLRKGGGLELRTETSAADWMSLVDVYYKGKCVLSKIIDGIPVAVFVGGHQKWFADCPFELEVVKLDHDTGTRTEDDGDVSEDEEVVDLSRELEEDVRMSWILLNKRLRRSVNVSSLKPLMVQKNWISSNNYTMQFGCMVPVDGGLLPHGLAECVITARCELTKVEGNSSSSGLRWDEIKMCIKDLAGAHLGRKKTLAVLNQALYCPRSNNQEEVGKVYRKLEMKKNEMKQARGSQETLANSICLIVVIFAALYYIHSSCNVQSSR